jgi:hydrogenase/urease accessory protein HupE
VRRALTALGLLLALAAPAAAQCVMCKTALTSSAEGHAMGAQFNHAILLMLFAPYVVAAAFTVTLFRRRIAVALRRFVRHSAP